MQYPDQASLLEQAVFNHLLEQLPPRLVGLRARPKVDYYLTMQGLRYNLIVRPDQTRDHRSSGRPYSICIDSLATALVQQEQCVVHWWNSDTGGAHQAAVALADPDCLEQVTALLAERSWWMCRRHYPRLLAPTDTAAAASVPAP